MAKRTTAETFGQRLARLRRARRLSQRALAAHAQMGRSFLARLETDVQEPTLTTLRKLAAALDVRIADLVEEIR
jgi:transcriptional regulator with XRE-family HTH domain